jgi:Flp pilus assembly protein TadG
MQKRLSLLSGRPSGQTLAEFAMVATLFFLLQFGIIEMGIVVFRYNTVSAAAREAARYAMVHSPTSQNPVTDDQIEAIAIGMAPFLNSTNFTTPFFVTDPNLPLQQDAKVSITYNYTQNVPFMSAVTLNLTSSSRILVSQ